MRKNIFSFILYLYEMMEVHKTYCNHFMIYACQSTMLWSLNHTVLYIHYTSVKLQGRKRHLGSGE